MMKHTLYCRIYIVLAKITHLQRAIQIQSQIVSITWALFTNNHQQTDANQYILYKRFNIYLVSDTDLMFALKVFNS